MSPVLRPLGRSRRRGTIRAALLTLLAVTCPTASLAGDDTLAKISVQHRFARDLEGPARAALSPQGRLVVDEGTNSLIVRDTPDAIASMRALLAALDVAPATVSISLRTLTRDQLEASRSAIHAGVRTGGVAIGDPPPSSPGLTFGLVLSASQLAFQGSSRQTIRVSSGQEATITLGGTQPIAPGDRRWGAAGIELREFGDSLWVRPTVLGDGRVRLELAPSSSSPADPRTGAARVRRGSTEIQIQPGESVVVGGVGVERVRRDDSFAADRQDRIDRESLVYVLQVTVDGPVPNAR